MRVGVAAALILALWVGCGGSGAHFATEYAPGFQRSGSKISVFGVYKNGEMSAEAWADLAPRLETFFGDPACEAAYGGAAIDTTSQLASTVEDETRTEGVTDELLGLFAPAATGDLIAVVTVTGQQAAAPAPVRSGTARRPPPPAPASALVGRGGGRRGRGMRQASRAREPAARDAFEMSIAFYSVSERRTVGAVSMKYDGADTAAGLTAFIDKVRAELPNTRCARWKPDVKIDPERVHAH